MYSSLQRLNQLASLATTALFALLFAISLSSYFLTPALLTGGKVDIQDLNVSVSFHLFPFLSLEQDDGVLRLDGMGLGSVLGKSRHVWNQEIEYGFVRFDLQAGSFMLCSLCLALIRSSPNEDVSFHCCSRLDRARTSDLRPLFHWNTKQVFLQLNAEYLTATNVCPCFSSRTLATTHLHLGRMGFPLV